LLQPVGESEDDANFAKFAAEVAEKVSPSCNAILNSRNWWPVLFLLDVPATLKQDRKLLKGFMTAVRTALRLALVHNDTRNEWKFGTLLKDRAVQFIVEYIRTTAVDAHSTKRSTLSLNNYDSLFLGKHYTKCWVLQSDPRVLQSDPH